VTVLVVYLSVRRGKPRLSLAVSAAGLVGTLVAALILIPRYGASGAAAASSIGYAAGTLLCCYFFVWLARRPDPAPVAAPVAAHPSGG
jgi:O-antigen/teichoic acid export membrane protein